MGNSGRFFGGNLLDEIQPWYSPQSPVEGDGINSHCKHDSSAGADPMAWLYSLPDSTRI